MAFLTCNYKKNFYLDKNDVLFTPKSFFTFTSLSKPNAFSQRTCKKSSANWSKSFSLFLEWFPSSKKLTSGALISDQKTLQASSYISSMWPTKKKTFFNFFHKNKVFFNVLFSFFLQTKFKAQSNLTEQIGVFSNYLPVFIKKFHNLSSTPTSYFLTINKDDSELEMSFATEKRATVGYGCRVPTFKGLFKIKKAWGGKRKTRTASGQSKHSQNLLTDRFNRNFSSLYESIIKIWLKKSQHDKNLQLLIDFLHFISSEKIKKLKQQKNPYITAKLKTIKEKILNETLYEKLFCISRQFVEIPYDQPTVVTQSYSHPNKIDYSNNNNFLKKNRQGQKLPISDFKNYHKVINKEKKVFIKPETTLDIIKRVHVADTFLKNKHKLLSDINNSIIYNNFKNLALVLKTYSVSSHYNKKDSQWQSSIAHWPLLTQKTFLKWFHWPHFKRLIKKSKPVRGLCKKKERNKVFAQTLERKRYFSFKKKATLSTCTKSKKLTGLQNCLPFNQIKRFPSVLNGGVSLIAKLSAVGFNQKGCASMGHLKKGSFSQCLRGKKPDLFKNIFACFLSPTCNFPQGQLPPPFLILQGQLRNKLLQKAIFKKSLFLNLNLNLNWRGECRQPSLKENRKKNIKKVLFFKQLKNKIVIYPHHLKQFPQHLKNFNSSSAKLAVSLKFPLQINAVQRKKQRPYFKWRSTQDKTIAPSIKKDVRFLWATKDYSIDEFRKGITKIKLDINCEKLAIIRKRGWILFPFQKNQKSKAQIVNDLCTPISLPKTSLASAPKVSVSLYKKLTPFKKWKSQKLFCGSSIFKKPFLKRAYFSRLSSKSRRHFKKALLSNEAGNRQSLFKKGGIFEEKNPVYLKIETPFVKKIVPALSKGLLKEQQQLLSHMLSFRKSPYFQWLCFAFFKSNHDLEVGRRLKSEGLRLNGPFKKSVASRGIGSIFLFKSHCEKNAPIQKSYFFSEASVRRLGKKDSIKPFFGKVITPGTLLTQDLSFSGAHFFVEGFNNFNNFFFQNANIFNSASTLNVFIHVFIKSKRLNSPFNKIKRLHYNYKMYFLKSKSFNKKNKLTSLHVYGSPHKAFFKFKKGFFASIFFEEKNASMGTGFLKNSPIFKIASLKWSLLSPNQRSEGGGGGIEASPIERYYVKKQKSFLTNFTELTFNINTNNNCWVKNKSCRFLPNLLRSEVILKSKSNDFSKNKPIIIIQKTSELTINTPIEYKNEILELYPSNRDLLTLNSPSGRGTKLKDFLISGLSGKTLRKKRNYSLKRLANSMLLPILTPLLILTPLFLKKGVRIRRKAPLLTLKFFFKGSIREGRSKSQKSNRFFNKNLSFCLSNFNNIILNKDISVRKLKKKVIIRGAEKKDRVIYSFNKNFSSAPITHFIKTAGYATLLRCHFKMACKIKAKQPTSMAVLTPPLVKIFKFKFKQAPRPEKKGASQQKEGVIKNKKAASLIGGGLQKKRTSESPLLPPPFLNQDLKKGGLIKLLKGEVALNKKIQLANTFYKNSLLSIASYVKLKLRFFNAAFNSSFVSPISKSETNDADFPKKVASEVPAPLEEKQFLKSFFCKEQQNKDKTFCYPMLFSKKKADFGETDTDKNSEITFFSKKVFFWNSKLLLKLGVSSTQLQLKIKTILKKLSYYLTNFKKRFDQWGPRFLQWPIALKVKKNPLIPVTIKLLKNKSYNSVLIRNQYFWSLLNKQYKSVDLLSSIPFLDFKVKLNQEYYKIVSLLKLKGKSLEKLRELNSFLNLQKNRNTKLRAGSLGKHRSNKKKHTFTSSYIGLSEEKSFIKGIKDFKRSKKSVKKTNKKSGTVRKFKTDPFLKDASPSISAIKKVDINMNIKNQILIFKKPINITPLLLGYNKPYGFDLDFNLPTVHLNSKMLSYRTFSMLINQKLIKKQKLKMLNYTNKKSVLKHLHKNVSLNIPFHSTLKEKKKKTSSSSKVGPTEAWFFLFSQVQLLKIPSLFAQPSFSFFMRKKLINLLKPSGKALLSNQNKKGPIRRLLFSNCPSEPIRRYKKNFFKIVSDGCFFSKKKSKASASLFLAQFKTVLLQSYFLNGRRKKSTSQLFGRQQFFLKSAKFFFTLYSAKTFDFSDASVRRLGKKKKQALLQSSQSKLLFLTNRPFIKCSFVSKIEGEFLKTSPTKHLLSEFLRKKKSFISFAKKGYQKSLRSFNEPSIINKPALPNLKSESESEGPLYFAPIKPFSVAALPSGIFFKNKKAELFLKKSFSNNNNQAYSYKKVATWKPYVNSLEIPKETLFNQNILKQKIGFSNDFNSFNNKFKYLQKRRFFATRNPGAPGSKSEGLSLPVNKLTYRWPALSFLLDRAEKKNVSRIYERSRNKKVTKKSSFTKVLGPSSLLLTKPNLICFSFNLKKKLSSILKAPSIYKGEAKWILMAALFTFFDRKKYQWLSEFKKGGKNQNQNQKGCEDRGFVLLFDRQQRGGIIEAAIEREKLFFNDSNFFTYKMARNEKLKELLELKYYQYNNILIKINSSLNLIIDQNNFKPTSFISPNSIEKKSENNSANSDNLFLEKFYKPERYSNEEQLPKSKELFLNINNSFDDPTKDIKLSNVVQQILVLADRIKSCLAIGVAPPIMKRGKTPNFESSSDLIGYESKDSFLFDNFQEGGGSAAPVTTMDALLSIAPLSKLFKINELIVARGSEHEKGYSLFKNKLSLGEFLVYGDKIRSHPKELNYFKPAVSVYKTRKGRSLFFKEKNAPIRPSNRSVLSMFNKAPLLLLRPTSILKTFGAKQRGVIIGRKKRFLASHPQGKKIIVKKKPNKIIKTNTFLKESFWKACFEPFLLPDTPFLKIGDAAFLNKEGFKQGRFVPLKKGLTPKLLPSITDTRSLVLDLKNKASQNNKSFTTSLYLNKNMRNNSKSNNLFNIGIPMGCAGQIIHINQHKITLRRAQPIFISPKSILHFNNGSFVRNNEPVMTLTYQRLKTGDIVQGIPKVEQYLEARITKQGRLFRDCLPNLLKGLYKRYRTQLPLEKAVRQSFYKMQQIIVDGVLRVYRSQGVTIADKHLEVIVKQMTSKVKIINGAQTGFFPGEIIDLQFVEKVNLSLMKKIQYEPLILGITRAALEVDSFLSAASFQQTTRVLSSAAIEKRKDFLKGLKENILLGNLMPAGTGYLVSVEDAMLKTNSKKVI